MKFSENWLRQHVAIDADSAALAHRLTPGPEVVRHDR